jgi:hypothetical protein
MQAPHGPRRPVALGKSLYGSIRAQSLTTAPADDGRPNATAFDQNAVTVHHGTSHVNGQELLFQLGVILPHL